MIRLLYRYCSRRTVVRAVCDMSLLFVVFAGACLIALDANGQHNLPATQGLSLLAGLVLINTASGLLT